MRNLLKVSLLSLTLAACDCSGPVQRPAQGELRVTENSLDFGQACPRPTSPELKVEEVTRTVHIQNVGRGALTLNKFEVEADRRELFLFDATKIPGELESQQELEVPITFVPNGPGTIIASLTIEGDEEGKEPFVVRLIGEGKSAPPNPGVIVSCRGGKFDRDPENPNDTCAERDPVSNLEKLRENANFFFPDAPAGEVAIASFKIRNTGCPTLEVTNIAVTTDTEFGADPGTYALDAGQKDNLAVINGAEGEIKVAFNPKLADAFDGALTFTTNDPAMKEVRIPLKGLGIEPQIVALPQQCDLRTPGACNGKITLRNAGDQDLTLGDITLEKGSANFSIAGKPAKGTVISANGGQLVDAILVEYTPDISADVNDYVVINSNAGQARVLLRGGSFPVLKTDPEFELSFGENLDPTKTHYQPLTIRNFATWAKQLPLHVTLVRDADRTEFSFAADPSNPTGCPAAPANGVLPPISTGQEQVVCVAFTPPLQGTQGLTANIRISSDDPLWSGAEYIVAATGSTSCNPKPIAEITVPTDVACGTGNPCSGQAKCIGGFCHATGSYTHSLAKGDELEISCAASYDLTGPTCQDQDPSGVVECEWSQLNAAMKPANSNATVNPAGKTSQKFTKLKMDKVGNYIVRVRAYDATGQSSGTTPVSYTINVTP